MVKKDGISYKLLLDPRICPQDPTYTITKSGTIVSQAQFTADSASTNNIQFTIRPNAGTFVSRKILMNFQGTFRLFTDPAGVNAALLVVGAIPGTIAQNASALRWMPVHYCADTAKMSLNSCTVTTNFADYIEPLTRFRTSEEDESHGINAFGVSTHDKGLYAITSMGNRNPLAFIGNSVYPGRGTLFYSIRVPYVNNSFETIVDVDWSEECLLPGLLHKNAQESVGFWGLTTMQIQYILGNGLSLGWSHDPSIYGPGRRIVRVAAEFRSPPTISITMITPVPGFIPPSLQVYPYYRIDTTPTTPQPIAVVPNNGSTIDINITNQQLTGIPSLVYLFVREVKTDMTANNEDIYMLINSINVSWMNYANLLGDRTTQDLYQMSSQNGLQMTWADYRYRIGSVICINLGKDLNMSTNSGVGSIRPADIRIKLNVTNLYIRPYNVIAEAVFVTDGIFVFSGFPTATITTMAPIVTPDELNGADLMSIAAANIFENSDKATFYGTGIKENLSRAGRKLYSGAKKAAPYIREYGPKVLKGISTGAELLGLGYDAGGYSAGGGYKKKRSKKRYGGALVTNPQRLLKAPSLSDRE